MKLRSLPPLSLYVHIPWCLKKCPYCDFNSHETHGPVESIPESDYVKALCRDLEAASPQIQGRRITSIFFGGGTPSLFSARSIDAILTAVENLLPLDQRAEITLEANPGTFESEKFAAFHTAGINRLSIGIQSFNPSHLHSLGRIHDDIQGRRAIDIAKKIFDNVNIDLMYALPGQTLAEARQDIEAGAAAGVSHISAYHLTLEPNTLFHRYPPRLPDDDLSADMQLLIEQTLAQNGYINYETSAFAQIARESRHNTNYWLFGDYLGIGAGAHSKISHSDRILRQMRYKQPREYITKALLAKPPCPPVMTQHDVEKQDVGFEFMMNALRLTTGFATELFIQRTGLPIAVIRRQLDAAEKRKLITCDQGKIIPTLTGRRFLNDLLQIFLPEQAGT